MFVYKGHCLAIGVGIQVNNLFYYITSIRVAQGAKYEIPQTRSIRAIITSEIPPSNPLMLVGDLNCKLGNLCGPRSSSDPNQRGTQWMELIDNHSLYVPSLSTLAPGPVHTFHSSRLTTTIDYVVGNLALATVLVSCRVVQDHPLNTSDHLPIISNLNLSLLTSVPSPRGHSPHPDWNSGQRQGRLSHYASLTDEAVSTLHIKDYSTIPEIDVDISSMSSMLVNAALSSIPHSKHPNVNLNKVYDPHLSTLCWCSRATFHQWKAAGSPRSGPLYEERKTCKKYVNTYLSQQLAQLQRKVIQKCDKDFHSHHPKRLETLSANLAGLLY